ncbi:MAG: hypothetical protein EXR62_07600 [Chloroflexi bacterium]|nr:hypothetical protein [Chloroflexota bacterium]
MKKHYLTSRILPAGLTGLLLAATLLASFTLSAQGSPRQQVPNPLVKRAEASEVLPGDLLTFTMSVDASTNTSWTLSDPIPLGTQFYRVTGGTFDAQHNLITAEGMGQRNVTLVVRVSPDLDDGKEIFNNARLNLFGVQWSATAVATVRRYYVPQQIVVTGPAASINAAFDSLQPPLRAVLTRRILLGYLATAENAQIPFPPGIRGTLEVRLYEIVESDNTTIADAVRRINAVRPGIPYVFAEPNYLTGRPPTGTSGDPWGDEGSPVTGSPLTATNAFTTQWAFGPQGISLTNGTQRTTPLMGGGIRVGIFDTSPFTLPTGATSYQMVDDLKLLVSHPALSAILPPPTPTLVISDHGLFAASLVNAVAPDASLKLVRVLNEYGQGDLFDLNLQLSAFITETRGLGMPGIINLSLGVNRPPNLTSSGLPPDIISLQTILGGAVGFDFVTAAATGNDSSDTSIIPLQIPAAYSSTIAVGASSYNRDRACFSNAGTPPAPGIFPEPWLTAPGGDCVLPPPNGYIIGRGLSSPTGFLYWRGTSFATPIVSGLAALAYQRGGITPLHASQQIKELLLRGAANCGQEGLAGGIATVWKSLDLPVSAPAAAFLCGDFNLDVKVTTTDLAAVVAHWHTQRGQPNYRALYDFNANTRVTISDLMAWGKFWGNTWP